MGIGVRVGVRVGGGVGVGMLLGPTADLAGGVTKPAAGVGVVGLDPDPTYGRNTTKLRLLSCWLPCTV